MIISNSWGIFNKIPTPKYKFSGCVHTFDQNGVCVDCLHFDFTESMEYYESTLQREEGAE